MADYFIKTVSSNWILCNYGFLNIAHLNTHEHVEVISGV